MEKWLVTSKRADFKAIAEKYGIDQVIARVIRNRDITEDEDIRIFLGGGLNDLYDPHLMKDADKLTDILAEKIKAGEKIRVIGDYDIDGVMSSYILKKALMNCNANVDVMIPDRILDGYGLNVNLIEKAREDGVDTIITCDNGIAALEEISLAKDYGMTVLVTDHHEVPFELIDGKKVEKLSKADAIVNPHQSDCKYPNKNLCGAAVAWKMVIILYEKLGKSFDEACIFLENVAFATVGDIMSLVGENRILVKEGLKKIRHTNNTGMKALIELCRIDMKKIDAYHFGFVLGPCINASGRLDTAKRALELFFEEDEVKAKEIASELVVLNEERKAMTSNGVDLAKEIYEKEGYEKDKILVIYIPEVHESIAGIIAGRIREAYNKPTFIITKANNGAKGSGRSIEQYSMYEEMCKCSDLLDKFGGHPMAAGLSLKEENIDSFRYMMNEKCTLSDEDMIPKIRIDVPMPIDYVTFDLVRQLDLLGPFGKDNERPVFADKGIRLERIFIIGKNKNVLKLKMITSSGRKADGIFFGDIEIFQNYIREKFSEEELDKAFRGQANNISLSFIYKPMIDDYNGMESLTFEIKNYQ